jgi:peroxin-3
MTGISLENRDDDNVDQAYGNDFETNRKYLAFSWWILHEGWRTLKEKITVAVNRSFGPVNPRDDITLERLSGLIIEVRKAIEGESEEERRYVLKPEDDTLACDPADR